MTVDVPTTLRACALFADLSAAELDVLASAARTTSVAAGGAIWRAGTEVTSFIVLAHGSVKISCTMPGGERALLLLFVAGDAIGMAASAQGVGYPADCDALSDVELVHIPRGVVVDLAARCPSLRARLAEAPIDHVRLLQQKIAAVQRGSIEERLATALVTLAARTGVSRFDRSILVPLPLSRRDLAEYVGARVESVIRVLARWQREGLVETRENGFVIAHVADLEAVAGHAMADVVRLAESVR
jgi:CRP-like cAMP-binding protein